jgi:hypothetical protein
VYDDISGRHNDGTEVAATTVVPSSRGMVHQYNGTSSAFSSPSIQNLGLTTQFTVSAWLHPYSTSGHNTIIGKYDGTNSHSYFFIFVHLTNKKLNFAIGDGTTLVADSNDGTSITTGRWWHLALTLDTAGNAIRYVNGQPDGSVDDASALGSVSDASSTIPYIGAHNSNGTGLYHVDGMLQDVRIYNRVLSHGEMRRLYIDTRRNPLNRRRFNYTAAMYEPPSSPSDASPYYYLKHMAGV